MKLIQDLEKDQIKTKVQKNEFKFWKDASNELGSFPEDISQESGIGKMWMRLGPIKFPRKFRKQML